MEALMLAGDSYGSYTSTEGDLGNPGIFALIPEPGSLVLLLAAGWHCAACVPESQQFAAALARDLRPIAAIFL